MSRHPPGKPKLGLTKLTVDKRNGSEYLRIEAATEARVSYAQRVLAHEAARYLREAPSMRKRKREYYSEYNM